MIRINQTLIDPDAVVYAIWKGRELTVGFIGGGKIIFEEDEAQTVWALLHEDEPGPGKWREDVVE